MVDYDVMVFMRYKHHNPLPLLTGVENIWQGDMVGIDIMSKASYLTLRRMIINKEAVNLSEIQLIKPRKA